MSEGFPYGDIVILALVAGFILLRLRSILGQKTDNDKPDFLQSSKINVIKDTDTIVQLSDKSLKPKPMVDIDPYLSALNDSNVLQAIKDIKAKDPIFNATSFVEGAKMAFEMVFDAFAKGDKQTLSMLLSQEIYNDFLGHIEERERQENRQETTLLSVKVKEIFRADLDRNIARIAVRFESEQVTIERAKTGDIVSGDPSDVQHVIDEWVLERDITSKNPNWKIIET
ncbi:MAG: Tim44/TimA family putative adaptor protein [Pseudomonadota bacterium]